MWLWRNGFKEKVERLYPGLHVYKYKVRRSQAVLFYTDAGGLRRRRKQGSVETERVNAGPSRHCADVGS